MEFMSVAPGSLEESTALLERFYEYLESVKEKLPRETYTCMLGAWQDGHIELTYAKVQSYLFDTPRKREYPMRPGSYSSL